MIKPGYALAMLLVLGTPVAAQIPVDDIRKEWPDFRYLEPSQLRTLPATIREDLVKRGCRIPMFTKWDARHNAIQGQFLKAGQQDWAVLCQSGDNSGILLYPGGTTAEVLALRNEETSPYRAIHTVSAYVLRKRAIRDRPAEPPPPFDHDGIEDGPIQKQAIVLYYNDGVWDEF